MSRSRAGEHGEKTNQTLHTERVGLIKTFHTGEREGESISVVYVCVVVCVCLQERERERERERESERRCNYIILGHYV